MRQQDDNENYHVNVMLEHDFGCDALNDVVIRPIIMDKRKPSWPSDRP